MGSTADSALCACRQESHVSTCYSPALHWQTHVSTSCSQRSIAQQMLALRLPPRCDSTAHCSHFLLRSCLAMAGQLSRYCSSSELALAEPCDWAAMEAMEPIEQSRVRLVLSGHLQVKHFRTSMQALAKIGMVPAPCRLSTHAPANTMKHARLVHWSQGRIWAFKCAKTMWVGLCSLLLPSNMACSAEVLAESLATPAMRARLARPKQHHTHFACS